MSLDNNSLSAKVLNKIQHDFPIEPYPYKVLAEKFSSTEDEIFETVQKLREDGAIRRIGAFFDASHLGYTSSLCAIALPEHDLKHGVDIINSYHNVTHNYERPNHYNVWFTLIAPSKEAIKTILHEIAEKTGYDDILYLPTKKLYKIRVNFSFGSKGIQTNSQNDSLPLAIDPNSIVVEDFSELDKAIIRELQKDISNTKTPFEFVAQAVSKKVGYEITERVIRQRIKNWKFNRTIRRFGAAVRHRKVGFSYNAMCVWDIDDEVVSNVAPILANNSYVTHCYERPRRKTWDANIYTMVHGTSKEECKHHVDKMIEDALKAGYTLEEPRIMYSTQEFKKTSMKYFLEDEN